MEQRHRDLPNNAHSVGLRSPRFIDQSLRSGEVVHDVASFSPVPVSATQGVVSMDIGGSPVPHSKAAINGSTYPYGYHDSDVPLYGDAPRTVAYSVNDSTMQLSDVSGEIAAAEERLAELEEKGSAAALNRGMYERRASGSVSYDHEGKKNGTAPPSRRDSYLSNGTLSPLNDQDSPPASRAPLIEPADIPQARFSLVAIQKKAAQNRPLVSVAVEVAEGVVEYVRLYEGDNYETCQKHALEMIEKHNLDLQAALETLTEHLCSTLDEYRSTNGPVPIAAAGQRPRDVTRDVTRDESVVNPPPRSNQRSAAEPKKAAPSSVQRPQPSKSPNRREVQPSPMRSARTTTSVSSTVADRSAHPRDTSASRLRSLSARRQVSPTSATISNNNTSFAGITSRYLSPAPERPPPPPENHAHKPTLAPGSRALSSRPTAQASAPAHERLYQKQSEIDAKRKIAIRARDEVEAQDRQRSHSNHRVRGLSWDHFTVDDKDPGHRLYDSAIRQQKRHEEKAAKVQSERKSRELEGHSFHPTINSDGVAGRSLSQRRRQNYHDPFYAAAVNTSSSQRDKVQSTAERELQECTFKPKTNKRTVSPRAKRTPYELSVDEECVELEASDSSSPFAAEKQYRRSVTPTRSSNLGAIIPPSSKATSVTNDGNTYRQHLPSTTSTAQSVTDRLFHGAREREERLERARRLAQTVDSKTGKPLFAPQVHR